MKVLAQSISLCMALFLSQYVTASVYQQAVSHTARSNADVQLDERRKPAEVMAFFEIQQGDKVLDIFAGGGYYSELLSYVVGDRGHVTLYNNHGWQTFVQTEVTKRLAKNRLPNVVSLVQKPEQLATNVNQYDKAIFILGMHDLYYADPKSGWVAIDRHQFLQQIYQVLKPGGVFGVIDANANNNTDDEVISKKLHRINPKSLVTDITKAGFEYIDESDILANPNDDKSTSVFLPQNRYRTDRSVLKFRKPIQTAIK